MWPTEDSTTKSGPRYPAIVRAFAGDSTMTRRFGTGGHDSRGIRTRYSRRAHAAALPRDRRGQLAFDLWALPATRARPGEPACERWLRPRLQPRLEPRSVASRAAALAAPLAALHGEGGALLVAGEVRARRCRGVPGAPRARRSRSDRHGPSARARGKRRRDVPGGHAPGERRREE